MTLLDNIAKLRELAEAARSEFVAVMGASARWADSIDGAGDRCDPCGGPTDADTFIAANDPATVLALYDVVEAAVGAYAAMGRALVSGDTSEFREAFNRVHDALGRLNDHLEGKA
jgi:hypothetical protein